jgi:hypothetical protein
MFPPPGPIWPPRPRAPRRRRRRPPPSTVDRRSDHANRRSKEEGGWPHRLPSGDFAGDPDPPPRQLRPAMPRCLLVMAPPHLRPGLPRRAPLPTVHAPSHQLVPIS